MKKKLLCLFFFFICAIYQAQNNNYLDAILSLEKKNSKESFLDTILSIKYDKALTNTKKYLSLITKAETIAKELNSKKFLADVYKKKSLAYFFSSKLELAIQNTILASNIYNELNDFENYADSYINLGWQIKNRDLEKAIFYMNKGIKTLEKEVSSTYRLIGAYNNYGVLKQRKNQLDSALYYHKKSLSLCLKNKDSIGIPFAQTHIGEVYLKKKMYSKAKKEFFNALKIRQKRNDLYGITDSYLYLGDLFFAKKDYTKSLKYFKLSEKLAIQNSYYPLRKYATEYIYKNYENKNDVKNALNYFKILTKLNDSILNKQTNSKIAELEVEFDTKDKEIQIANQKKELLEKELAIKNRTLYSVLLGASLLILGIVFFSVYKRNQLKKKQLQKEIDLKDALAAIKTQNRLQEQRLRISRDLHDNIGSQLTFIISSIDNLKFISKDANQKLKDKLSNISSFTSETIHQLRDTIWAMNKSQITMEDIHSRILSLIEKAKLATENITFEVNYNIDDSTSFSSLAGMNIFRVVQEAINNAIKYAEASKITIAINEKNNELLIAIDDNGNGFDIKTVSLGNGLSNMEKRMSEINGKVKIESEIKKGTNIQIICKL
ncbi:tetratricopeptide repeat-containing sensor histidine kinase [Polaribacter septentrionalilitoris]|uniref:tetratricopeptide repeat-containing sensor histidine kinase n=1 Tax=Polaribacter septentrionalilitoris TaxID=2494657 RepID=UPI00135C9620|nr:sensor histidine kinase [Polaribacter septentrionalilitoris]